MSNENRTGPRAATKPASGGHEQAPEQEPISTHKVVVGLVVLVIAAVVLAALGILARVHGNSALAQQTNAAAAPTVNVAPAKPGAPADSLCCPAT